ncbi:MAG: UDP-N-acetylenolpyruvoylglucosamine reductase [Flavobacteriales bacterium]|nr:UDP-N-acetylenolpyruvoylglucosamine reductase [Flavobacteriales bacterium]|tara:strand:- start:1403 stop:2407 length:1005 start_codon:yes stop_codon:yes gene_type:complete
MEFNHNHPLKNLNTFGIYANAENFANFNSIEELKRLLENAKQPLMILGGGSNILLTQNIKGSILKNEIFGIDIIEEDNKSVAVKVGGGVVWHDFVSWSIERNLGGLENLSLIPGSVGAAPMQNIGAYGSEIKSVFKQLEAVNIESKELKIFENKDCQFGYRTSIFKTQLKNKYVICSVTFRLNKYPEFNTSYGAIEDELRDMGEITSLKSISQAVINIRSRKLPDPNIIGNSGSFFKNPTISNIEFQSLKKDFPLIVGYPNGDNETKVAAGWLIEQAGWKGFRDGDAGVHKNQALVLVNYGNAKGKDILNLSKKIQDSVEQKFGIQLIPEVNIL